MLDSLLTALSLAITKNWAVAPLLSFIAGILTSFTPCALGTIPLVVFCVGNSGQKTKYCSLKTSIIFALGNGLAFMVLGFVFAYIGQSLSVYANYLYIFLGIILAFMALQLWELYDFLSLSCMERLGAKKGKLGAFMLGLAGGIFSSPCATPVLVVLLSFIMLRGNLLWSLLLMLCYALGNGLVIILIGTSTAQAMKLLRNSNYKKITRILQIILGMMVLLLSFYMFYLGF